MGDLILSPEELRAITGGYKRPRDQLAELLRQGFFRARVGTVTGAVIVERAHYDAVCRGRTDGAIQSEQARPRLRPVG
jgi:hypothetical protein